MIKLNLLKFFSNVIYRKEMSTYQRYYKSKIESDPEYRAQWNACMTRYRRKRYNNDEEFKKKQQEKVRNFNNNRYNADEEYRQRHKEQCLRRYHQKKDQKLNEKYEELSLAFFRSLFEA